MIIIILRATRPPSCTRVVGSAYVLLMTAADAVVSLPEPSSSETSTLSTVKAVHLFSVFPDDVAMEVLGDCRLSLVDVLDGSVTLGATLRAFTTAVFLIGRVTSADVDAGCILFLCELSCGDELITVDGFDGDAITDDDSCSNDHVSVCAEDESCIVAEISNALVSSIPRCGGPSLSLPDGFSSVFTGCRSVVFWAPEASPLHYRKQINECK